MRVRDFRWDVLPNMFDEYEDLEKVYYGIKKVENERDQKNMKRLFEIIQIKPIPKSYRKKIPYKAVLEIARIMPEKNQLEFAVNELVEMKIIQKADAETKAEIEEKLNFVRKLLSYIEPKKEKESKLTDQEKNTIGNLIEAIEKEKDGEALQTKIFQIAKDSGMKPAEFFRLVYQILLKSDRGPKLGPYIIEYGKEEVIKKLKEAL
jgi:lysyl-tRNA synthetase class 1